MCDQHKQDIVDEVANQNCNKTDNVRHNVSTNLKSELTKREGLLMFVVVVLLASIFATVCVMTMRNNHNDLTERMRDLEVKLESLKGQIEIMANESNKPLDITVNINGKDFLYNPETGELENPNEFPADFDTRPFLGIGFYEDEDGYETPLGPKIDIVYEGSPAAKAGLKIGDILMAVNGQGVSTFEELSAILDKCNVNDEVTMQIITTTESGISVINVKATLTYRGYFESPQ